MRFFTVTFAAVLCLGAFAQASPRVVRRGGGSSQADASQAGSPQTGVSQSSTSQGPVVEQSYSHDAKSEVQTGGRHEVSEAGILGLGGCPDCVSGPSQPTTCAGIIQSLVRQLFPTLDCTAELLDRIVIGVLNILGVAGKSDDFHGGQVVLLSDLLGFLGCTLQQLLRAIVTVVNGL